MTDTEIRINRYLSGEVGDWEAILLSLRTAELALAARGYMAAVGDPLSVSFVAPPIAGAERNSDAEAVAAPEGVN